MRLQFWKRKDADVAAPQATPEVKRFNVTPRTDIGQSGLPADPELAAKVATLRRRREGLRNELRDAEAAASSDNRWSMEIRLVSQAIDEVTEERDGLDSAPVPAGVELPETPIAGVTVNLEPSPQVSFQIGAEAFRYEEPAEWAERGFQVARVELELADGDPARLLPGSVPSDQRDALVEHLSLSLFEFATDMRDRALAEEPLGQATLGDLARPAEEDGGWLDWQGNSPIRTALDTERARLDAEIARLEAERTSLAEERDRLAEQAPFIARRLAEVETALTTMENRS